MKRHYNSYELMMRDRQHIIDIFGKAPRLTAKFISGKFFGTATF